METNSRTWLSNLGEFNAETFFFLQLNLRSMPGLPMALAPSLVCDHEPDGFRSGENLWPEGGNHSVAAVGNEANTDVRNRHLQKGRPSREAALFHIDGKNLWPFFQRTVSLLPEQFQAAALTWGHQRNARSK